MRPELFDNPLTRSIISSRVGTSKSWDLIGKRDGKAASFPFREDLSCTFNNFNSFKLKSITLYFPLLFALFGKTSLTFVVASRVKSCITTK